MNFPAVERVDGNFNPILHLHLQMMTLQILKL
jgi:hypothetical protein